MATAIRKITAHEAVVRTASVEVKALTISGKQVTLSVFRQLPEESLLDNEANLRGLPWGKVNYFWGDCQPNHLHVVWQSGDRLFRSCVMKVRGAYEQHRRIIVAGEATRDAAYLLAMVRALNGSVMPPPPHEDFVKISGTRWHINVNVADLPVELRWFWIGQTEQPLERYQAREASYYGTRLLIKARAAESDEEYSARLDGYRKYRRRELENMATVYAGKVEAFRNTLALPGVFALLTPDGAAEAYDQIAQLGHDETNEALIADERWQLRYAALDALDQLFIAV